MAWPDLGQANPILFYPGLDADHSSRERLESAAADGYRPPHDSQGRISGRVCAGRCNPGVRRPRTAPRRRSALVASQPTSTSWAALPDAGPGSRLPACRPSTGLGGPPEYPHQLSSLMNTGSTQPASRGPSSVDRAQKMRANDPLEAEFRNFATCVPSIGARATPPYRHETCLICQRRATTGGRP